MKNLKRPSHNRTAALKKSGTKMLPKPPSHKAPGPKQFKSKAWLERNPVVSNTP